MMTFICCRNTSVNSDTLSLNRSAALFLMRSKTEGCLTALRDVTNGARDLYQEAFSEIKKEIAQMIKHVDMPVAAREFGGKS